MKLLRALWLALPLRASASAATLRRRDESAAKPLAAILAGVGVLTLYAFSANIPQSERLPGIDAPIHHAWEDYTQSVLGTGELPHWNPYSWAGTPYLAAPSTGVLYPPAMLLRWLEPAAFLQWMVILHLLIGAAGAASLTRVVGVGWWGAAAAALAFTLGGASGGWVHTAAIPLLYNAAWLPWALALSIVSVRRRSLLPHPALPLVMVVQFMAALQPALYITGAVCLYYLFSVARPESGEAPRWRPLAQLAVLGVLSAGLSAFQLLPVRELASDSTRLAGLSFERAAAGGWAPRDLATVFWPLTGVDREPAFRFVSHRVAYVGWILACLVPFAFTDRPRRRLTLFFALLATCATLLALGSATPVFQLHYALFPGLRIPGRVLFVTTLSLAVLGALGFERFVTLMMERRWRAVGGAFVVGSLGLSGATIVAWQNAASDVVPPSHLWPWLPVLSIAGLLIVATLSVRRHVRVACAAGVLILAIDVSAFFSEAVHTVPIERLETLRQWVGPPDTGRLWSLCRNRIGSNEMLLTRRPGLEGTVDLDLNTFAHWLQLVSTTERREDVLGPQQVRRDLLDSANVTTFVSCEPLDDSDVTLVSHVDPVFAYRNERAWPRATWTCRALELPRAMVAQELKLGRYDEMGALQRQPWLTVRWAADVSDDERQALERKHGLLHGVPRDTTWRYVIGDPTTDNLRELARHPSVDDTNGLDRGTGELIAEAVIDMPDKLAREMELLVGAAPCAYHADVEVLIADQPDGHVAAVVEAPVTGGFVFFSEPYYRERLAFVDGRTVTARRANLAFTAVPVPAGTHRVELRMVPTSFYAGVGLSGLTVAAWCLAAGYGARRR